MIIGEEEMKNERQLLTVEDGPLMQGRESVRYLILHCSATRCDKDYTAEQLLRDHKTRGFRTVGYHFYIRRDGTMPSLEPLQHRHLLRGRSGCGRTSGRHPDRRADRTAYLVADASGKALSRCPDKGT